MARAILITGNSRRFLENNFKMEKYLRALGIQDISRINGAYLTAPEMKKRLMRIIARDTEQALLICYSGHGSKYGLAINEECVVYYADLAGSLFGHERVLIILDCCHAFSLTIELERQQIRTSTVGLIASCGGKEKSATGLIKDIVAHWGRREVYPDQRLVRHCDLAENSPPDESRGLSWMVHLVEDMRRFPARKLDYVKKGDRWTRRRWGPVFDKEFF